MKLASVNIFLALTLASVSLAQSDQYLEDREFHLEDEVVEGRGVEFDYLEERSPVVPLVGMLGGQAAKHAVKEVGRRIGGAFRKMFRRKRKRSLENELDERELAERSEYEALVSRVLERAVDALEARGIVLTDNDIEGLFERALDRLD